MTQKGGFAYVYLVKETPNAEQQGLEKSSSIGGASDRKQRSSSKGGTQASDASSGSSSPQYVLKVTSILSRNQRDIAEKEAQLLQRLSHPSIVKLIDTCYRTVQTNKKERAQHLILMEYCEGGHSMDVCTKLIDQNKHFDLSTLIIAMGQISNAVSYLHAQRPPIVHRDLKPENFLIKNGSYKLCDFGSAVFGHTELKTQKDRSEAEEVIEKTTTQMFRAPEMVDLYMAKKLTQATDVWALGCCLYSLAFLKNCFEEGSNLAILSCKYKIPDNNPYGPGLVELIDRMLCMDSKSRADMTEVILCLSAVYSGRELPPRKERKQEKKKKTTGTYRTDGQGIAEDLTIKAADKKKKAKKLDPNSAAARRKQASAKPDLDFAAFSNSFDESKKGKDKVNPDAAFDTTENPFATNNESFANFEDGKAFEQFEGRGRTMEPAKKTRSRSQDHRRKRRDKKHENETPEETIERLANEDQSPVPEGPVVTTTKKVVKRGVRRMASSQPRPRSLSRGAGLRRTRSGEGRRGRKESDDSDESDSE